MLIVGVVERGAGDPERHELQMTRRYHATLDEPAASHLRVRLVDELEPIEQSHTIEGLEP